MKIRCKDKEKVIGSEAAVIGGKAASLAAELRHWVIGSKAAVIELSHWS